MFCKMANFELQTRVPMMIRAPWLNTRGSTTAVSHSLVLATEFGANSNTWLDAACFRRSLTLTLCCVLPHLDGGAGGHVSSSTQVGLTVAN